MEQPKEGQTDQSLDDLRQAYADVVDACRRRNEADAAEIARMEESNATLQQARLFF